MGLPGLINFWSCSAASQLQSPTPLPWLNTLRQRQNGCHFTDDILKCIFLNENVWIPIEISWKFVPKGPNDNIPALVYIMAWRRPGDKPLSEPRMTSLPMHICVTRPQWVNPQQGDVLYLFHQKLNNATTFTYIDNVTLTDELYTRIVVLHVTKPVQ